jgi:hypothetical protein
MTELQPYRVVLALFEPELLDSWIHLAARLSPPNGEIHLCGLVSVPEDRSLSEGVLAARGWRTAFRDVTEKYPFIHEETRIHIDYRPMARLLNELAEDAPNLLITEWMGVGQPTGGLQTHDILQNAPYDLVLAHGHISLEPGPVLLSLRGGPNLSLGIHIAKALADGEAITLFHAADYRRSAPDLEVIMRAEPQITRTVTAVSDITDGILGEIEGHKAIVLGARFHQLESHGATRPIVQQVQERTSTPLVLIRAWQPESLEFHAPHLLTYTDEGLSQRVDRWFAENTFDSHEFEDLNHLMALKERQGVTISVGLPALNEEETVGQVIGTLKKALMDDIPLVDEIVLIDSNSTDNTVAIAQDYGIPVYVHQELLPEVGSLVGKGEALWKSLYVLNGDIIAWADTDITNIHPRFIYGLIGPMLKNPRIQYVKGFYHRPIKVGEQLQAYGGGRVTELVARPLLNLFYPELSGIIQPLAGEYAGRRSALEQLSFFSGYGVETGLLIDMLERFGLGAIAQTDLETRVHHNQPLVNLSKMSFAILQVFIARLESRFGVQLLEPGNHSMKLIIQEPERFALGIEEITDVERPPMVTIPSYQERFTRVASWG